jgi:hypothetical protein
VGGAVVGPSDLGRRRCGRGRRGAGRRRRSGERRRRLLEPCPSISVAARAAALGRSCVPPLYYVLHPRLAMPALRSGPRSCQALSRRARQHRFQPADDRPPSTSWSAPPQPLGADFNALKFARAGALPLRCAPACARRSQPFQPPFACKKRTRERRSASLRSAELHGTPLKLHALSWNQRLTADTAVSVPPSYAPAVTYGASSDSPIEVRSVGLFSPSTCR